MAKIITPEQLKILEQKVSAKVFDQLHGEITDIIHQLGKEMGIDERCLQSISPDTKLVFNPVCYNDLDGEDFSWIS